MDFPPFEMMFLTRSHQGFHLLCEKMQKYMKHGFQMCSCYFLGCLPNILLRTQAYLLVSSNPTVCIYIYIFICENICSLGYDAHLLEHLRKTWFYRFWVFQKWGYAQIIHLNRIFHYKPSILAKFFLAEKLIP